MRTRQKRVATDTWRSLGCRTTPLEHWSKRKPTVEPRWAKQQTKKLRPKPTKINSFMSGPSLSLMPDPPACNFSKQDMIVLNVCLFCLIKQVSLNISILNSNKKCNSVSITRMPLLKHKVQLYLYSLSIFVWRTFSIIKSWFEHLNFAITLLNSYGMTRNKYRSIYKSDLYSRYDSALLEAPNFSNQFCLQQSFTLSVKSLIKVSGFLTSCEIQAYPKLYLKINLRTWLAQVFRPTH